MAKYHVSKGVFCLHIKPTTGTPTPGNGLSHTNSSCQIFKQPNNFIQFWYNFSIIKASLSEGKPLIFLNEITCNEFDERICTKLREISTYVTYENTVQVDCDRIPCYQKIVDLIDGGIVEVEKRESDDFQKTCAYFNLVELHQYAEIYFMEG